jgi:hypothetical protein
MAISRPLLHLPILAAAGTALYAASLSFVTAEQSAADARVMAAREPLLRAAADAAANREQVTAAVQRAVDALKAASGDYASTVQQAAALDAALQALATSVQNATGMAATLPDRVSLPAPQTRVVTVTTAPATQAVTGASGAP